MGVSELSIGGIYYVLVCLDDRGHRGIAMTVVGSHEERLLLSQDEREEEDNDAGR